MSTWGEQPKQIFAITLFADNLEEATNFYTRIFDLTVHFQNHNSAVFKFGHTLINLLQVDSAKDLIAPALIASPGSGSRSVFTIGVDDVDAACEELIRKGVELVSGPMDRTWGVRTANFMDPTGHSWEIAQPLNDE
jgi:catechol 2,3-dioxygenase-like lactoylglutathione lyase family enzyme